MSTPPEQPGNAEPKQAKLTLQERLDELLLEIEAVEPGAIDPEILPEPTEPEAAATPQAPPAVEAEIDALLNAPPVISEPVSAAEPATEPAASPSTDAAADATAPEQADMLAALNTALQGINDKAPADDTAPAEAAEATPAAQADEPLSMEEKLQQEIAALMNAEPEAAEAPPTEAPVQTTANDAIEDFDGLEGSFESPENLMASSEAVQAAPAPTSTTEDLIAQEIEGLLNTGQDEPPTESSADTAIDELDKMLAQEIDADDELAGDFQSVEDLTAGIQVLDTAGIGSEDEHAATARDVAAELDSQPEDLPDASFEPITAAASPGEDPFAVLDQLAQTAEQNEQAHQQLAGRQAPDWGHWLEVGQEKLLNACYLINWPARRFLNAELRQTLGHISLTVACTSSLFLLIVLIFG